MGSIASLPSLGHLQAALTLSLAGISQEASSVAMEGIRQIPAFGNVSDLSDLVSQDSLSRMVFRPASFDDVTRALNVFADLPALKETFGLPTLEERLNVCAQVLDLRYGVQIYWAASSAVELDRFVDGTLTALARTMSRALKDELDWPDQHTLETLGSFAVSTRKVFDARADHLNGEQRHHLMQLAVCLDAASRKVCAYDSSEHGQQIQARKMATLIDVLYGCGFGDEEGMEAAALLGEVERSYVNLFGPEAPSCLYASGALWALDRHLASLKI